MNVITKDEHEALESSMEEDASPYGAAGLHDIHDVINPTKDSDLINGLDIRRE